MEKRRVVITGLGTVNPLGNTAADSWAAAKAGRCGIGPITQFDTTDFKCKLAGEVKNFDPETVVDKKEARKMARFTLLALAAAAEAIADTSLMKPRQLSNWIGIPMTEIAHELGAPKSANLAGLGAAMALTGALPLDTLLSIAERKGKPEVAKINMEVIRRGAAAAQAARGGN